jgi:hypothetical protein
MRPGVRRGDRGEEDALPRRAGEAGEPDETADDLLPAAACGDVVGADVQHDVRRARHVDDLPAHPLQR